MALLKRVGKYSVRYSIPTRYRDALGGRSQVWRSTGTGCLTEAKRREPRILANIMDEVENAYQQAINSPDSPRSPAYLFEAAAELLAREDLTEEQKSDILSDYREKFLRENRKADQKSAVTAAQSATTMLLSRGRATPLSVAMKRHLDDLRDRGRNTSTVERKEMVITRFRDWAGNPIVSEVDRQLVGEWIDEDLNKTDLTPKTKGWYLSALQSAWTYFMLHGMTHDNPFERMVSLVQLSKKGVEQKHPRRPWTQEEIDKLKLADHSDPIYTVSVIRLHSGIRVEEACTLRAADVDLEANTMRIGGVTKTQSSQRTLPLHPVLQALMPTLIEQATEDGYLFYMKPAGRDDKRSHNFSKRVNRWITKHVSKDPGVIEYTLRHTYSQAMRDLGVDKETIEFTTGHRDQSELFGTYAKQVGVERLRQVVEKLDFGFPTKPQRS